MASSGRVRTRENETAMEGDCPECGGKARPDGTEHVCEDCGVVVSVDEIDRGPEWRQRDESTRRRTGLPVDESLHNRGLETRIGNDRVDFYGNPIPAEKRRQLIRLRKRQQWVRSGDARQRNLGKAFGEIRRMCSALDIDTDRRDQACQLYRQAQDADVLLGRSIEGVAGASLFAIVRVNEMPILAEDIAHVSRVGELRIRRALSEMKWKLDLPLPPQRPQQFVGRIVSELSLGEEVRREALALIDAWQEANPGRAVGAKGVAAGAVYFAAQRVSPRCPSQRDVAETVDSNNMTVRTRYHEMQGLEVEG